MRKEDSLNICFRSQSITYHSFAHLNISPQIYLRNCRKSNAFQAFNRWWKSIFFFRYFWGIWITLSELGVCQDFLPRSLLRCVSAKFFKFYDHWCLYIWKWSQVVYFGAMMRKHFFESIFFNHLTLQTWVIESHAFLF
jgi:hypothetical protein